MTETPAIATARLLLRPHRAADLEALTALHTHPVVVRGLAGVAPTAEDCWQRLLRYAGHWALFGFGLFAVCERESGRVIGEAGHAGFGRMLGERFDTAPEAAWIFHPDSHGRGLATEAMRGAERWLDQKLGPGRTVCIIRPDNAPSLRLAERLGYRAFGEASYKGSEMVTLERQPQ